MRIWRIGLIMGILGLSAVGLAGCQSKPHAATKVPLKVAMQTYQDKDGQDKLTFGKHHRFWRQVVTQSGTVTRDLQTGTYQTKRQQLILNIDQTQRATYKNKQDLTTNQVPLTLSNQQAGGYNEQTVLTKTATQSVTLQVKGNKLVDPQTEQPLARQKQFSNTGATTLKQVNQQYTKTGADAVNQRTFVAKLPQQTLWIAFNGDHTWQMHVINRPQRTDTYDQGTWQVDHQRLQTKSTGAIRQFKIKGAVVNPTNYQSLTELTAAQLGRYQFSINGSYVQVKTADKTVNLQRLATIDIKTVAMAQNQYLTTTKQVLTANNPFKSQAAFKNWLNQHHATTQQLANKQSFKQATGLKVVYVSGPFVLASDGQVYQQRVTGWEVAGEQTAALPMIKD
ncbi:hypothetical protein [Lactiplantibacillus songbeiensis]|uniref:Lipoprotein n=1 Tax=Lactiplantibacillus songbeiensis TaxID=2559920 RepID=A0ABW4C383_9LACO|nr:hypothetical protein [Lactiplantibacillus songbeiensis]